MLLKVGSFIYALVWLARLAVASFYGAFIVDALSRTSKDLVTVPLTTDAVISEIKEEKEPAGAGAPGGGMY